MLSGAGCLDADTPSRRNYVQATAAATAALPCVQGAICGTAIVATRAAAPECVTTLAAAAAAATTAAAAAAGAAATTTTTAAAAAAQAQCADARHLPAAAVSATPVPHSLCETRAAKAVHGSRRPADVPLPPCRGLHCQMQGLAHSPLVPVASLAVWQKMRRGGQTSRKELHERPRHGPDQATAADGVDRRQARRCLSRWCCCRHPT
eukprot:365847-Chlamydomonas_euryale.AAC.35